MRDPGPEETSPVAQDSAVAQNPAVAQKSAPTAPGAPERASPHQDAWREILDAIRQRIQPEQFETWFRRAALTQLADDHVCITVQNVFSRDWLRTYYVHVIAEAAERTLGGKRRIEIAVDSELTLPLDEHDEPAPTNGEHGKNGTTGRGGSTTSPADTTPAGEPALTNGREGGPVARKKVVPPFDPDEVTRDGLVRGSDIGLNPKYTFENFVVGPCNRFAHAAAVGVAELPGRAYNPLFLHGSVGLGKTHLLQSISFALLESWTGVRILFLSCETFVNHFISALENGDLQKFRNKYRNVDVLVVDDIHVLANKERTQEEFFHTFNTLYNAGKQIVLSSDSPPKDIPTLQERLVSRFKWGLVTEMERPCYETRMAIIKRKSRERGREIPESVAGLVAERIDSNIRELEGAVTKLLGYASLTGSEIDESLARDALPELFTVRRGQPTMEDILNLVTDGFGVKLSELQSKKRTYAVAYPRQIGMYLARKLTRHSLEDIGGYFGGRDHSTVLYGVDKIERLLGTDEECRKIVCSFMDELQSHSGQPGRKSSSP